MPTIKVSHLSWMIKSVYMRLFCIYSKKFGLSQLFKIGIKINLNLLAALFAVRLGYFSLKIKQFSKGK